MQNMQNMQNISPLFFSSKDQKSKISESESLINSRTCLGHLVLFTSSQHQMFSLTKYSLPFHCCYPFSHPLSAKCFLSPNILLFFLLSSFSLPPTKYFPSLPQQRSKLQKEFCTVYLVYFSYRFSTPTTFPSCLPL